VRRSDDADWVFEFKHDGFRALAFIQEGVCRLVSRNGNTYKRFGTLCESIARELRVHNAVLDGEIVCVDDDGRSNFKRLMYRRGEPHFYAFDVLWLNGRDLRGKALLQRKVMLRSIV